MNPFSPKLLSKQPRVIVSFTDKCPASEIAKAKKRGVYAAELRIDLFSSKDADVIGTELDRFKAIPRLATIRSHREGGKWKLSEKTRLDLYERVLAKVDAVDIELSSQEIIHDVVKAAHFQKKIVIGSFHDFKQMPRASKLASLLKEAERVNVDILKIAVCATSSKDIERLADFTIANRSKNLITITMGAKGSVSRIIFPAFGSLLTYASLGQSTAPGQLSYKDTLRFINYLRA